MSEEFELPEEFNETVKEECIKRCNASQEAYEIVKEQSSIMKRAESVLAKFQNRAPDVTREDVEEAKQEYQTAKPIYQKNSKMISDEMPFIYQIHRVYPNELVVHRIYNQFLAKLLSSREARNPVEQYVLNFAKDPFNFEDYNLTPSENEENQGKTTETLLSSLQQDLSLTTHRLEGRYKKRQLMVRLKQGERREKVIQELTKLLEMDAEDIKTYILIARLLTEHYLTVSDHAKRIHYRDLALQHCNTAFTKIDAFLDLQGVEEVYMRDKIRVGFIKTISAIRNPIIK